MMFSTCDFCDAHEASLNSTLFVLPDVFRFYGATTAFAGRVHTVQAHNGAGLLDNSKVREAVAQNGQGRVLLMDGAGLLHNALMGGNLALLAAKNNWAGVLVYGAVRDAAELRAAQLPVRALALCPLRTVKRAVGERGKPIWLQGVEIHEGDWLYADEDGILISRLPLHEG
jgi:regulator of ribonuclease activity A